MAILIKRKPLSLLALLLLLGACTKGDGDLRQWVNEVKNRPAPALEPLPLIEEQPVQVYSPDGLRDPFGKPPLNRMGGSSGPSPDLNRRRQPLEAFTLDGLSMVGTIGSGANLVGLVLAPDKVTYRVRPGVYMGQSDGRIISVSSNRIELVELVPDGSGGWLEREAHIAMDELKSGDTK
jgi:type IV pilus assembly protein PilP